jgi:hypothetical protein
MTKLYSWIDKDSPDLKNYKENKFTYSYRGVSSEKAFWFFDLKKSYRPGAAIAKNRLLLAFDFGAQLVNVIENVSNHLDFESTEFKGETKHKIQIIVKNNEPGAYGVGAMIRPFLTPKITLASKTEVAKALGKKEKEVATQKW